MRPEKIKEINIHDSFWQKYMNVVKKEVIPYQWAALNDQLPDTEPSHAIENFRIAAGESSGEYHGMVFQDSDVAKWLEAVAYSLENDRDPELEATADEVIALIGRAQQPDGYVNTYYTIKEPGRRWTNLRDNHELYCAGHLLEAAIAYYQATGKEEFLNIMRKYMDYIATVFGTEEGKIPGYPGHQEIELALLKLYDITGEEKYLSLSEYFLQQRARQPHYFDIEKKARGDEKPFFFGEKYTYHQAHLPVEEQDTAVGHSVRALYMYTAMADLAAKTNNQAMYDASRKLWKNVTRRQMYVTAGLGSSEFGESFTTDYDLPNDTSYTETCASIALVFWARQMLKLDSKGEYGDVMERALYNGTISGMDLEGKRFFYVNPLEVSPVTEVRHDMEHVKTERQKWFNCACCPPNLARMITSLGHYVYGVEKDKLFTHLYLGNDTTLEIADTKVTIEQQTDYPWDGAVTLTVSPEVPALFTLAVRIPGWCKGESLRVNGENIKPDTIVKDGYAYIRREWQQGDEVELNFPMPVERISAHPRVRENVGKVALQRGPVVYCLEETDNGENLPAIYLPQETELSVAYEADLLGGVTTIQGEAVKLNEGGWEDELYQPAAPAKTATEFKAVPYYAWGNRGKGEMLVWVNRL